LPISAVYTDKQNVNAKTVDSTKKTHVTAAYCRLRSKPHRQESDRRLDRRGHSIMVARLSKQ